MVNFKKIDNKKTAILIKYIVCLLIIELIILLSNFIFFVVCNKTLVTTDVYGLSIDNSSKEDLAVNFRYETSNIDKDSYYIKVNCKEQNVIIYIADENGEYTIPFKKMICSTGKSTPTKGIYSISDKYEWRYLVGNVYGQYATRITGQILFHSVPYTKKDKSSLEYWEYDKLGQPVSKGCVRLTVEDSKWIFDNCKPGTKVEFINENTEDVNVIKANLPLKITNSEDKLKGWDPTDPDKNNPWKEYKEQDEGEIK